MQAFCLRPIRWCRYARPPANHCDAFGIQKTQANLFEFPGVIPGGIDLKFVRFFRIAAEFYRTWEINHHHRQATSASSQTATPSGRDLGIKRKRPDLMTNPSRKKLPGPTHRCNSFRIIMLQR